MSSIIEQATRRLEELKRAGIEVPNWDMGEAEPARDKAAPRGAARRAPAERVVPLGQPDVPARGARAEHAGQAQPDSVAGAQPDSASRAQPDSASRALPDSASRALVQLEQRVSRAVELDLAQMAEAGYLVPGSPRSTLAEEMRAIKQPVLKNARSDAAAPIRHGNLIMLTSALPGEGKTFCAINLALSIASEVDSSVLLVDADVVRPALLGRLGLGGTYKGLLDLLTEPQLELSEVILKTDVPKLSVIPAGTPRPNATELLASSTMEQLLADISSRYADRIVIFDAPPLLATTESRVLAERMGQILMVVSHNHTTRADLTQAYAMLQQCPIVMSMLNRTTQSVERHGYGYAYAES